MFYTTGNYSYKLNNYINKTLFYYYLDGKIVLL